jgi:hypothetical protein
MVVSSDKSAQKQQDKQGQRGQRHPSARLAVLWRAEHL